MTITLSNGIEIDLDRWQPLAGEETIGWHWTVTMTDGSAREYRTDLDGTGLFSRDPDGSWNQSLGHGQFSAPQSKPAMMQMLRNHWAAW